MMYLGDTAETERLVWAQWCCPDSLQYAGAQRQFGSWRNPVKASEKFHDISRLAAGETSAIWFHVDCFDNAILCHQRKSETMHMDQSKPMGKQKFSRMGNTRKAICWPTPGLQPQENVGQLQMLSKGDLTFCILHCWITRPKLAQCWKAHSCHTVFFLYACMILMGKWSFLSNLPW